MDVRVKLVPILADRKLLVVIDWNEDLLCANWLLVWVMELSHVWMLKSLLGSQPLAWVKLEKILQKVNSVI